jgi:hypothetical protein
MQPAPPSPKLNLRKLESLQRFLRYGAAAVLLVFLVLIALSAYKLIGLNREIVDRQVALARLNDMLRQKEQEVVESNKTIERQKETVKVLIDPDVPLSTEQAEQVKQTVEENIREQLELTPNIRQIPARVYFHIGQEDQRKLAGDIARRLQARGYIVPGIENVAGKAKVPEISQLRYYQTDEMSQSDLRDLFEFFRSVGVRLDKPVLIRNARGVRARHYEIWFGDDFPLRRPPPERIDLPAKASDKSSKVKVVKP